MHMIVTFAALCGLLGMPPVLHGQETSGPPNIVLIYLDDLGFSDIGSYGRTYGNNLTETPHMDQLVKDGMKFTNAYAPAPLCSPSRAALLTGRSPARLHFEFVTKRETDFAEWEDEKWAEHWSDSELLPPPFTLNLPLEEVTIAEVLAVAGYQTAIVGKWHLNAHYQQYNGWSPVYGPRQQGFEYAMETFGAHSYAYRKKGGLGKFGDFKKGEYPRDELTDSAIDFIKQDHKRPFFLYVGHYFVHKPLDVKARWLVDKYKAKAGPDVSDQRILYAAVIETLDYYIGQLLEAIDARGLRENTMVILTSDNGGDPEFAFNRPFRGSKWNLYEGGIRVPLIVRWPGVVKEGSSTDVAVVQTDFMPTFREIAGLQGKPETELDGQSILPVLRGEPSGKFNSRSIVWHFPYSHPEGEAYKNARSDIGVEDEYISKTTPQSAIRKGRYKLIYFYNDSRFELYDLLEDPAEQSDISKQRPWDAQKMKKLLFDKLYDVDARFPRKKLKQ